jgi:hypothetical protein
MSGPNRLHPHAVEANLRDHEEGHRGSSRAPAPPVAEAAPRIRRRAKELRIEELEPRAGADLLCSP